MKLMLLAVLYLFTFNSFALHVTNVSPSGTDVDTGAEIRFTFNEDITTLGNEDNLSAQTSKIIFNPEIGCDWEYEGTRTLKCLPVSRLTPDSKYALKVASGFQGLDVDKRIASDQDFNFKTNELAILSYKVVWNDANAFGEIVLNYAVKPLDLSGTIQCATGNVPVKLEVKTEGKIQLVKFTADPKLLEGKDSCSFYFNKPLTLLKYPIKAIPREKVVISKEVPEVMNNRHGYANEIYGYCQGSSGYGNRQRITSLHIPQISCESTDKLQLGIYVQAMDVEYFVKVTPSHGVKISNENGYVVLSGFRPKSTYIITVNKDILPSLKSNIIVQFDATDSPPLLGSKKPFGILEKHGPVQVPYSALNIKSVELNYKFITSKNEFKNLVKLSSIEGSKEQRSFELNLVANQNTLIPVNVKPLMKDADVQAGIFAGTLSVKDVEAPYEYAEGLLIENDKEARRSFRFAFLITDIGLHMKVGEKGILVWATSLKTGRPLRDVNVVITGRGVDQQEEKTNKDGIAFFEDVNPGSGRLQAVATLDEDISYISTDNFWNKGISLYDFNLKNYYDEQNTTLIADVVAERPLYLPGEDVELKFFVREDVSDGLEYKKAGESIDIVLQNSRDEEILRQTSELNKFGTAVIKLKLDPKAATGDYIATIKVNGQTLRFPKAFSVQEFRKPEIKVSMDETADAYTGKVSYYSGGDFQNAEGQIAVIFKSTRFKTSDPGLKKFSYPKELGGQFYEWDYYYHNNESSPEVLSREVIETNDKGTFTISKAEILKSVKKYGHLTVEAIFKDSAGGNVAGRISTVINPYTHIPGIELTEWFYNVGQKINPRVVALDKKGVPASGVKMELEVKRINWIYERRLGSGNYFYYDSRRDEKVVHTCNFTTNANFTSCDVELQDGGTYYFSVKAKGSVNLGPAIASTWVVKKDEYFATKIENHDRINIQVENNELKLGDKVKLMVMAPFTDGEALITFERDGILYKDQVSFKGNILLYEKELKDEKFIPGFYVSVVLVKGRTSDKIEGEVDLGKPQFKLGYTRVNVANMPKRLAINVQPQSSQIKPGEEMEVKINVKDSKGNGTYSELAIVVVDDSLLSLAGNYKENYDILDTFYNLKRPKVNNFQSLTQLIGRRTYGKKGTSPGGGGGITLRSEFKNTAYWAAQIETDKKGRHNFKFRVPDNLTTWKIIAVAADENHRFGFGENEFLATKPLTVEPILPNFLVEGDKFLAQVSVANRSGEKQDILISAMSKALQIDKSEMNLSLLNGGRSSVHIPMKAGTAQNADITFQAEAGKLNDGFKLSIPVERQSIMHVAHTNGIVKDKPLSIPVAIPDSALKESVLLNVDYSRTALSGLDEVFRYVLGYPYGCWEQRLSKAYFLVQYEEFKSLITYRFPETKGSIKDAVQNLLDLSPEYQTMNGGMRYYPGGDESPDVYLSIFTAYSFNMMKKVGYRINKDVESKLKAYLRSLISSDSGWASYYGSEMKNSNKALVIAVLAEMGETGLNASGSKLYSERNSLDLFGLSFLGGYLHSTKGFEKEAENIFSRLDSLKKKDGNQVYFTEPVKTDDTWKYWNYTDTRSQCAVLQNKVSSTEDKNEAAGIVRHILSKMKDGRWYNTQENMYCFEGLRRFVDKFEKNASSSSLLVNINGKQVDKKPVFKNSVHSLSLSSQELKDDPKNIEIRSKEKEELYYSTFIRYETPYVERPPTNNGFGLNKQIFRKEGNVFKELHGKVLKLKKGDTLKVVLTVTTPSDRYQVILNDRLAGCFEPINMKLATSSEADGTTVADEPSPEKNNWSSWYKGNGFEYMDLRLNAAQFYSRHMDDGTYSVEYLVQVRTAGVFSLPESTVEEMYYPEIRGSYSGKKVIVAE